MNASDSFHEKMKAQRAAQRRAERLAKLREERAERERAEQHEEELRQQAAQQARDLQAAEDNKRVQHEAFLAQARSRRRIEARATQRRAEAHAVLLREIVATQSEQKRDDAQAERQRAAQQEALQAAQRQQRQSEDTRAQRQAALRDARLDEQRQQQRTEQQREADAAQRQAAQRQQRQDEDARAQRHASLREIQIQEQREQQRAEQRQQRQDDAQRTQRQAALRDAQLAEQRQQHQSEDTRAQRQEQREQQQRTERRQQRQDEAQGQQRQAALRDAQLAEQRQQHQSEDTRAQRQEQREQQQRTERRQQRQDEAQRAQRQAALRVARLSEQRELRRQADAAKQRAEALRAQEAERHRNERNELEAEQQRRAEQRAAAGTARSLEAAATRVPTSLSWLKTDGNRIINESGNVIYLRGVNVVGLDSVTLTAGQTLADALALDARTLSIMIDLWGANVVRLPFHAQTVLTGSGALSANDILAGLDQVVNSIAQVGAYALLALQSPVADLSAALPDTDTFECWRLLATRYQDEPGVLYEIYASSSPLPATWLEAAGVLVGTIRKEHPASLLFVGSAKGGTNIDELPLRFATGAPVHNIVYTIRVSPQLSPIAIDAGLSAFTQSFSVFASEWSDDDLGRSSELAAAFFERNGIGWAASSWNVEPRLVRDAAAHDFTATRFGLIVRRALVQPTRPSLTAFPGSGPAES